LGEEPHPLDATAGSAGGRKLMHEWRINLDSDLNVEELKKHYTEIDEHNGPLGIMFIETLSGCVCDERTRNLDVAWKPYSHEHTWAYVRKHYPNDGAQFYTNAVDEIGAFANLQAWLKEQDDGLQK
jgi:hypothetical protein